MATPVLTAWLEGRKERRRLRHERWVRDETELRALLDESGIAFDEAISVEPNLGKTWMRQTLADCTALLETVQTRRNRAVVLKARLETRLGPCHAVTRAYDEAIDRFDEAVEPLVDAYATASTSAELDRRPSEQARTEAASAIRRSIEEMHTAMNRFSEEAHKLAGFELSRE